MIQRQQALTSSLLATDHRLGNGTDRNWFRPVHLSPYVSGYESDMLPLAETGLGFSACDILTKSDKNFTVTRMSVKAIRESARETGAEASELVENILDKIVTPRKTFAGLNMDAPHVMGIINVTPDSFSDGGDHILTEDAIKSGITMVKNGASMLDIGGESTRPGAEIVGDEEECKRILPVIRSLSLKGYCVSADTRHPKVMRQATAEGAMVINDVGGLRAAGAPELVADIGVPVVIMHMQGEPGTMQKKPQYDFVPADVYDWLEDRIELAITKGVRKENIAVDIGFGFGKTPHHNMMLMSWLTMFHGLGVPLLLGVSRKSSIAFFSRGEAAKDRLPGSLALATLGFEQGIQIYRVHDVSETVQALSVASAMRHCETDMGKS